MAQFQKEHTLKKEDYLREVNAIVGELEPLVARIECAFEGERRGKESADGVLMALEKKITSLYTRTIHIDFPPVECSCIDEKFQSLVSRAHDLILPFCGFANNSKRNKFIEDQAVRDFKETLQHMRYEMKKVR